MSEQRRKRRTTCLDDGGRKTSLFHTVPRDITSPSRQYRLATKRRASTQTPREVSISIFIAVGGGVEVFGCLQQTCKDKFDALHVDF